MTATDGDDMVLHQLRENASDCVLEVGLDREVDRVFVLASVLVPVGARHVLGHLVGATVDQGM